MSSENLRVSGNAAYVFGTLGKDKFNLLFLIWFNQSFDFISAETDDGIVRILGNYHIRIKF
jgi:hypothetical protein